MQRKAYEYGGQVQGVGFRPFIFRLATALKLQGWVQNTAQGVRVELQGEPNQLQQYEQDFAKQLPPLARITWTKQMDLPLIADHNSQDSQNNQAIQDTQDSQATPSNHNKHSNNNSQDSQSNQGFQIIASQIFPTLSSDQNDENGQKEQKNQANQADQNQQTVLVSPDMGTCPECLQDLFSPGQRQGYAFTNCTNCGPRFSITHTMPYDRASTSMSCFKLCPSCQAEYTNPYDRRFHAEPNACPECGPQLWLQDTQGQRTKTPESAMLVAAFALQEDQIIAIKGLGGFHLACSAFSKEAITQLRQRKNRPHKALAVMVPDLDTAKALAHVSEAEAEALQSPVCPIVIVRRKNLLPDLIAPDLDSVGLMLPSNPLQHLLLAALGALNETDQPIALVMTSGNAQGEPIALGNREALSSLDSIADLFLLHNRDILVRSDDSVLRILPETGHKQIIRRSRGLVPSPISLPFTPKKNIIALGADLKSTICLTRQDQAFVSQHLGDLDHLANQNFLLEAKHHLENILYTKSQIAVCDLHPNYASTRLAKELNLPCLSLQHHFAHFYSVLAENKHSKPSLGLILDGTGLGLDGTIWGGELLYLDPTTGTQQRLGRLQPFALPSGEKAITEPWRIAAGFAAQLNLPPLYPNSKNQLHSEIYPQSKTQPPPEACLHNQVHPDNKFYPTEAQQAAIAQLMQHKPLLTSSCGRLFDAIAALLELCLQISYEGQAAIRLEQAQDLQIHQAMPYILHQTEDLWELDTAAMFLYIWQNRHLPVANLARQFHLGLIAGFLNMINLVAKTTDIKHIALSGGAMHNLTLCEGLINGIKQAGLIPLLPKDLPPNDGGICLGQAAFATYRA